MTGSATELAQARPQKNGSPSVFWEPGPDAYGGLVKPGLGAKTINQTACLSSN